MDIIITNTFKKKYLNPLSKHFDKEKFIVFLKEKNHTFIQLRQPYFKIKGHIRSISIRGIIFVADKDLIIPLMVFLKKDKKYGENINWTLFEDEILSEYKTALSDIKNGNCELIN